MPDKRGKDDGELQVVKAAEPFEVFFRREFPKMVGSPATEGRNPRRGSAPSTVSLQPSHRSSSVPSSGWCSWW